MAIKLKQLGNTLEIHGFGSFFENPNKAQDIDLLLLHQSITEKSCRFAITCKGTLADRLPHAHITMLSETEERQNGFIRKSNAVLLGSIDELDFDAQIAEISRKIIVRTPNRVFSGRNSDKA